MKLSITGPRGLAFQATDADEALTAYWRNKIREALVTEFAEFIEECAVTLRRMEPGETTTLESKPIKVELSRPAQDATA